MFTRAGTIMVKIDGVKFAEPKFAKGPNDFDICVHGTSVQDPNHGDYWRGEMSQNYGKGNLSNQTQAEITVKTLRKIGFEGDDLTTLADQINGKVVPFHVEASEPNDQGKVFYNVRYIEFGMAVQEIDANSVKARMTALFTGNGTAAPAATPAPATEPAPMRSSTTPALKSGNPFAKAPGAVKAPVTRAVGSPAMPF